MQRASELLATLSLLRVKGGRIGIIHGVTGNEGRVFGSIIFVLVEIPNDELAMRRRTEKDNALNKRSDENSYSIAVNLHHYSTTFFLLMLGHFLVKP